LYRGINEFKKGYQLRINIIKDENGNLLAYPHSVLNRWKNFFNKVLNVHGVHDVRQMDTHTAEPLVLEPSLVKVEIAIGKLKSYKSRGIDQISIELMKAGGETLYSEIHRLICSIWNTEELPQQWKESIIVPIHGRVIILTVIIIEESTSYQLPTKFYIRQILEKIGDYNGIVHQLLRDLRRPMTQLREKFFTTFCLNLYA
jgi:hypothetical protein